VKQGQRNFMGIFSTQEHFSLWLAINCGFESASRPLNLFWWIEWQND
jgi:hypothetical protein